MSGILYLVGTPIGNLGDMTDRAREVLAAVDVVAAEDTRRTGRLLKHFGIAARTVSLFEGNERRRTAELLGDIRAGRDVAVVSNAGMPGLSDPGYRLVWACVDAGVEVRIVPGPSSAIAALVVSGLPTDRFVFEGFLPRRATDRRERLSQLADDPRTAVLFESPRRVAALLGEIEAILGDRRVAVCRELTKLHEEVLRGLVSEVRALIDDRELKGELVVVIGGARAAAPDVDELVAEAAALVASGRRKREAVAEVARRHGASANAIYSAMIRH